MTHLKTLCTFNVTRYRTVQMHSSSFILYSKLSRGTGAFKIFSHTQRKGLTVRVCTVPYEDVPVDGWQSQCARILPGHVTFFIWCFIWRNSLPSAMHPFLVSNNCLCSTTKTTLWLSAREPRDMGIRLDQKLPSSCIFSSRLSATTNEAHTCYHNATGRCMEEK